MKDIYLHLVSKAEIFFGTPLMSSGSIQNIILLIAVIVAVVGIIHNRKLAKQKATLSFLFDHNNSQETANAAQILRRIESHPNGCGALSEDDKRAIKLILSKFEILAIGLEKNIYDYDMVIRALYAELIVYHDYTEQLIEDLKAEERRSGTAKDMPFEHFEKLVKSLRDRP